eukprot:1016291-Rhodomonas_salina.1
MPMHTPCAVQYRPCVWRCVGADTEESAAPCAALTERMPRAGASELGEGGGVGARELAGCQAGSGTAGEQQRSALGPRQHSVSRQEC